MPGRYMKIKSKYFRWLKNRRFIADIETSAISWFTVYEETGFTSFSFGRLHK